jgi:hypothetical protein
LEADQRFRLLLEQNPECLVNWSLHCYLIRKMLCKLVLTFRCKILITNLSLFYCPSVFIHQPPCQLFVFQLSLSASFLLPTSFVLIRYGVIVFHKERLLSVPQDQQFLLLLIFA